MIDLRLFLLLICTLCTSHSSAHEMDTPHEHKERDAEKKAVGRVWCWMTSCEEDDNPDSGGSAAGPGVRGQWSPYMEAPVAPLPVVEGCDPRYCDPSEVEEAPIQVNITKPEKCDPRFCDPVRIETPKMVLRVPRQDCDPAVTRCEPIEITIPPGSIEFPIVCDAITCGIEPIAIYN